MSDAPKYTTLRDYLRVVRERRVLILVIVAVFAGLALYVSSRQLPVYESQAALAFESENEDFSTIGGSQPITESPEQRAAIQARRMRTLDVAKDVQKELRTKRSPSNLLSLVNVRPEARTHFVVVTARNRDPEFAADVANAFAEVAVERHVSEVRKRLKDRARIIREQNKDLPRRPSTQITRAANTDRIARLETLAEFAEPAEVAVEARPASTPVSPKPIRNTILGALVGLTFGLVAAFMRDSLDRRFKSIREIREDLHMPLIGHVRDDMLGRSLVSVNGHGALSGPELEAFRILKTNVDFLDVDSPGASIVITSALPEEGKSTVAGALAAAYAASGRRTLLVECDLRRPTLAKRLGLNAVPGLSDYLVGNAGPQEILQVLAIEPPQLGKSGNGESPEPAEKRLGQPLVCITAGTTSPQPAELLGSARFKGFLEQVSGSYDTVILDAAPLLSVVDTLEIVPNVDRVVLCVRSSRTTRDQARAAKSALDHFPPRPMGVVVTGVRPGDEGEYGYYSYAYAYGAQD